MQPGVFLGFDFGLKRIGVAVGQSISRTANPIAVLTALEGRPRWEEIAALITAWQADALVVGIPYQVDGGEQPMTLAARQFAQALRENFGLSVYMADERFTSIDARAQMLFEQQEVGGKPLQLGTTRQRLVVDHYAAQLILEDWLKAHFNH